MPAYSQTNSDLGSRLTYSYTLVDSFVTDGILNQRIELTVPLDYTKDSEGTISIVTNVTQKYDKLLHDLTKITFPHGDKLKPMAYLQGGPGFPCAVPESNSGFVRFLLDKGYQLVFYDQRGTGLSSPIESKSLQKLGPIEDQLRYILNFRADSIVKDMEIVREALFGAHTPWLTLGQSYGGFCSFTYLSLFPSSLKEVLLTGGVPPVGFTADDVYKKTYARCRERNVHYYQKYPQDTGRVRQILSHLSTNPANLPNGGVLTPERFQQLGIMLGRTGGTDHLHGLVTETWYAIEKFGKPTYGALSKIENESSFDTNIIYALFQEAIYCDGRSRLHRTNWAADRTRYLPENSNFVFSSDLEVTSPVYFTGEMVYRSMYDDYAELRPLKGLADALHQNTEWSQLYDIQTLASISWKDVPVVGAAYYADQYVDFELTMKAKENAFGGNGNLRQYITSEFFHNGLRQDPGRVLGSLFGLLENEVD